MLTEQERHEIDEELKLYEQKSGVCIDALKIVQRYRGWVSDESIRDIAEYLAMSPDSLDNVATFYNLIFRRPVGAHVIFLCDSVSCWICGFDSIREKIQQQLGVRFGETTRDGQFTFLPVQCLGTCDRAPAMMIDGELFQDLTSEKVGQLLNEFQNGQRGRGAAPHEKY